MGLFKKKSVKNVIRDNEFLKDYAIKCHGLTLYVEDNAKVKGELIQLENDFQYTVASSSPDAKPLENQIKTDFEALTALFQQTDWDEAQALLLIRGLRRHIVDISSLR